VIIATGDHVRTARDALHFSRLMDRFVQNRRRFVGSDLEYSAAVEPRRRSAGRTGNGAAHRGGPMSNGRGNISNYATLLFGPGMIADRPWV